MAQNQILVHNTHKTVTFQSIAKKYIGLLRSKAGLVHE